MASMGRGARDGPEWNGWMYGLDEMGFSTGRKMKLGRGLPM